MGREEKTVRRVAGTMLICTRAVGYRHHSRSPSEITQCAPPRRPASPQRYLRLLCAQYSHGCRSTPCYTSTGSGTTRPANQRMSPRCPTRESESSGRVGVPNCGIPCICGILRMVHTSRVLLIAFWGLNLKTSHWWVPAAPGSSRVSPMVGGRHCPSQSTNGR